MSPSKEVPLEGGASTAIHRLDDIVLRQWRPWSDSVIALLRHLESVGFTGAPRVVGSGQSSDGREAVTFIEGESPHPRAWTEEAVHDVGEMLRDLHRATASFSMPDAHWMPWWGRTLDMADPVIGHCDLGPWNIVAVDGVPVAFIDWDSAGPVGRRLEIAQTAWLNAQLHDEDVASRVGLPGLSARAQQLRAFCDGYGLSQHARVGLVDAMVEVAVRTSAQEAIDSGVTPDGVQPTRVGLLGGGPAFTGHDLLWAVTWRTRSAAWMLRHRATLENALT
jgi:hypothetical protein